MLETLRKRLGNEKGFTLIELLVVMIILAILTAIAVPSYLSFANRAKRASAQADVRAIVPDIEAFYADHSTYVGATLTALQASYDQAINKGAGTPYLIKGQSGITYCVQATVSGTTWSKQGPAAAIASGACP